MSSVEIKVRKYKQKSGVITYRFRSKGGDLRESDVKLFKDVKFIWHKDMNEIDIQEVTKKFHVELQEIK